MSSEPRYVFGPLDRRALLLGLRGSQVAVLGAALLVVLAVMAGVSAPANVPVAFAVAAVAALVCFLPVADRTLEEWAPVTLRWASQRLSGGHRFQSKAPSLGHSSAGEATADLPATLQGIEILAAEAALGRQIGVIADRRGDTYTALLAVAGEAFALRESSEKTRLLAGWDSVLRSFGGEASPIQRVQWLERTAPDDGDALGRDLRARIAVPLSSAMARSYLEVLDDAGPVSTQHDVLLAVQISPRRAGKLMRQPGLSKDEAACRILVDQLRRLEGQLLRADLHPVAGGLTPRMTARALRLAADPQARTGLAQRALHHPDFAGVDPANAWPLAAEATWRTYRTDSAVHATYWVAEWPRATVGPDFLAPLLLATDSTRTVSVTMEPIGTGKANPRGRARPHQRPGRSAPSRVQGLSDIAPQTPRAREHRPARRAAAGRLRRLPLLRLRHRHRHQRRRAGCRLRRGRGRRATLEPGAAAHDRRAGPGVHLHPAAVPGAALTAAPPQLRLAVLADARHHADQPEASP